MKPSPETAEQVLRDLRRVARRDKAAFLPGFFQAVPGGYGEGDQFLGVVVPDQRQVAKRFRELSRGEIQGLLNSPWHECRLTGLLILVDQFARACEGRQADPVGAEAIVDFYLANLSAVNNWDLVDSSAPYILGKWLLEHPGQRVRLDELAKSSVLWERRIAILATFPLIRVAQFDEILKLSKRLLGDQHDLMHKAIGWMLREVGKRDMDTLTGFLEKHVHQMPRTMLRYSIEKMPTVERKFWLSA